MTHPRSVRMRSHAKVNLHLRVLGSRPDGYHEIETILHGIKLADEVEVTATSGGSVEVDMAAADGERPGELPDAAHNLARRAAAAVLAEQGPADAGLLIRIRKRIPIGAGLGGGSANAAGVLVALNELWDLRLDSSRLQAIAGNFGSDVPYCIGGGTALARSRGDVLTALPAPVSISFVLGLSSEPLSTAEVYRAWDEIGRPVEWPGDPMALAVGAGDVTEVASLLHNDLEAAAFHLRPELAELKQAILDSGALGACLSGSGPTLYGIAADESHAQSIARAISGVFDRVLVVGSQPECIERIP